MRVTSAMLAAVVKCLSTVSRSITSLTICASEMPSSLPVGGDRGLDAGVPLLLVGHVHARSNGGPTVAKGASGLGRGVEVEIADDHAWLLPAERGPRPTGPIPPTPRAWHWRRGPRRLRCIEQDEQRMGFFTASTRDRTAGRRPLAH